MKENNINISANGDKLLLGSHFIELKDESKTVFDTSNIENFINFLNEEKDITKVFYLVSDRGVGARGFTNNVDYNAGAAVKLNVNYSAILMYLLGLNSKKFDLDTFTESIKILRDYSDNTTLRLIDSLDSLSIKKVISVDRSSDNLGNFAYSVKSEKHGKEDYVFPKTLTFTVPLFEDNENVMVELPFDLIFKYSLVEGSFLATFKLVNLLAPTQIKKSASEQLVEMFKKLKNKKVYNGDYGIVKGTDAWKYKENSIKNI